MEFKQLKYFIQVAQEQNYTKAAKKLFISQPALSWQIKNLEEELGVKLFHYDGKKLCLTHTGEILLDHAEQLIDKRQKVVEELQNFDDVVKGHIRIGVPELFGFCIKSIMNFMKSYPEVRVSMVSNGSLAIQRLVEKDQLDLGVITNTIVSNGFDVIELPISYSIVLVVNKKHHLAQKQSISFANLKNETFINFNEENYTLGRLTIENCKKAGFTPNILLSSTEWDMIIEFVASGPYVSVIPEPFIEKYHRDDVVFIPFNKTEKNIPICLITKRQSPKSLPVEEIIHFLLNDIVVNA